MVTTLKYWIGIFYSLTCLLAIGWKKDDVYFHFIWSNIEVLYSQRRFHPSEKSHDVKLNKWGNFKLALFQNYIPKCQRGLRHFIKYIISDTYRFLNQPHKPALTVSGGFARSNLLYGDNFPRFISLLDFRRDPDFETVRRDISQPTRLRSDFIINK